MRPESYREDERNPSTAGRRGFLGWIIGWALSAVALLGGIAGTFRFLVPNVRYEPSPRSRIAFPDSYPEGLTYLKKQRVFLIRKGRSFQALSAVCTHLGCSLNRSASGRGYRCPCHGSRFDEKGKVLNGPAPRSLPWLAVELAADGRLLIDRSRPVGPTEVLQI